MRENVDQNNSNYGHFLRRIGCALSDLSCQFKERVLDVTVIKNVAVAYLYIKEAV